MTKNMKRLKSTMPIAKLIKLKQRWDYMAAIPPKNDVSKTLTHCGKELLELIAKDAMKLE